MFISQHRITAIFLQGELLSVDISQVDSFKSELLHMMKTGGSSLDLVLRNRAVVELDAFKIASSWWREASQEFQENQGGGHPTRLL